MAPIEERAHPLFEPSPSTSGARRAPFSNRYQDIYDTMPFLDMMFPELAGGRYAFHEEEYHDLTQSSDESNDDNLTDDDSQSQGHQSHSTENEDLSADNDESDSGDSSSDSSGPSIAPNRKRILNNKAAGAKRRRTNPSASTSDQNNSESVSKVYFTAGSSNTSGEAPGSSEIVSGSDDELMINALIALEQKRK